MCAGLPCTGGLGDGGPQTTELLHFVYGVFSGVAVFHA